MSLHEQTSGSVPRAGTTYFSQSWISAMVMEKQYLPLHLLLLFCLQTLPSHMFHGADLEHILRTVWSEWQRRRRGFWFSFFPSIHFYLGLPKLGLNVGLGIILPMCQPKCRVSSICSQVVMEKYLVCVLKMRNSWKTINKKYLEISWVSLMWILEMTTDIHHPKMNMWRKSE